MFRCRGNSSSVATGRRERRARAAAGLSVAGLLAIGLAGLASGAGAATPTVAKAQAAVKTYMGTKPFQGPTTAVKAVKGKKVTVVACPLANEGCLKAANAVKDAGKLLGWSVTLVDGKGDPAATAAAMAQAIAGKTDGIALIAIDRASTGSALAKAHSANIPVVGFADDNIPGTGPDNVFAEVTLDGDRLGDMLGQWIVADSNGKAKVAMFNAPELSTIRKRFAATQKVLKACRTCKIESVTNFTLATSFTQLPLLTNNVLLSHPEVTYVWNPAGAFGTLQGTTIDQTQAKGKVKVVTFDCVSTNLSLIRSGTSTLKACAATGEIQSGYAIVDQLNRAFAGQPAAPTGNTIPFRLIDKSNAPDPKIGWPGDTGFAAAYKKMWGIS